MPLNKYALTVSHQRNTVVLIILWSLLVFGSATWNLHEDQTSTQEKALIEANTIFQHNLAYRRWNSLHGGIYAKISEINQPNPYISAENRDIYGMDGSRLTIINPFQMTKQAYDLLRTQSPELAVFNRTVSLDPLNPENTPDEWETAALEKFYDGVGPQSEMTIIKGAPYMRLISPYVTERRCMRCHEDQGYEIDDIRGGMSIAVPMRPYLKAAAKSRKIIINTHLFLWLLGITVVGLLSRGLQKYQARIMADEEIFRIVSEFAYNFEYWINENKQLTFISPSCERITGYSRREFLEKTDLMFDMIHPADKELFTHHLADFERSVHDDMEYRIVTKDGATKWLSHVCVPIYAEGTFRGRRGSNIDITDQKKLQEKLQKSKKVEDIGHFASGVAHDFNNVLTSITTLTHLLEQNIDKDNIFALELSDNIVIASKLGQNLTSNLLHFGRKQSIALRQTKLNRLIRNIETVLQVLLRGNISLKVVIAKNEKPVTVDHHQIEQILLNLATNARDAMPEGGNITISVEPMLLAEDRITHTGVVPAGEYMILSVGDTGTGIKESVLHNILEPFYSTKSSSKGTGLGLAIVKNIVHQHQAFMEIDSTPGIGTTFRLFFPVSESAQYTTDKKPEIMPECSTQQGKTILLVDDDWLIRKSVRLFLEGKNHSVIIAEDGDEAIKEYKEHYDTVSLVILDVMLPKKNGRKVYDTLKKLNPDVKVIFISGSSDQELAHINITRETVTLLSKPLDMKSFSLTVEQMILDA